MNGILMSTMGYDQSNHVVYALGGGLVSFTTPF
jgi:hypothetical protein